MKHFFFAFLFLFVSNGHALEICHSTVSYDDLASTEPPYECRVRTVCYNGDVSSVVKETFQGALDGLDCGSRLIHDRISKGYQLTGSGSKYELVDYYFFQKGGTAKDVVYEKLKILLSTGVQIQLRHGTKEAFFQWRDANNIWHLLAESGREYTLEAGGWRPDKN